MRTLRIAVFGMALAVAALAADVAGNWKATLETPNGTLESSIVLKVDDGKITGSVTTGNFGEAKIVEGKVDGDSIDFTTLAQGPQGEFKLIYKGKVSGDEIKFDVTLTGMDRTFPIVAKRVK